MFQGVTKELHRFLLSADVPVGYSYQAQNQLIHHKPIMLLHKVRLIHIITKLGKLGCVIFPLIKPIPDQSVNDPNLRARLDWTRNDVSKEIYILHFGNQ